MKQNVLASILASAMEPSASTYNGGCGNHGLVEKHVFNKPFETFPHALLGVEGRVIMIRNYPKITKSNAVIPITEDTGPCAVGRFWDGTKFLHASEVQDV